MRTPGVNLNAFEWGREGGVVKAMLDVSFCGSPFFLMEAGSLSVDRQQIDNRVAHQ